MTNTTYFYDTIREEWSSSTSPNESPRPSFGNITLFQQTSSPATDDIGGLSNSAIHGESWKLNSNLSFKQLNTATMKFRRDNLVGETEFAQIYQGMVQENKLIPYKPVRGIAVAVKKLDGLLRFGRVYKAWIRQNKLTPSKSDKPTAVVVKRVNPQGLRIWLAEIKYSGQLCHPNLVRLFGHCTANEQRLLVYEFMPRGNLHSYLSNKSSLLSWNLRMKIALGAARGLAFLHSPQINVIHRDVTSCNILLDSNYNAKLCNFVLAMDGATDDRTGISIDGLRDKYGYGAPEYLLTGHLSTKTDVYAFGVVLFEIISGRSRLSFGSSEDQNLLEWARPYQNDCENIFHLFDSCLQGQCSLIEAQKAANLAYDCISMDAKCRPDMDEVVKALEELQKFERRECRN